MTQAEESDLALALDQFDRTQANVNKLSDVWTKFRDIIPDGPLFEPDSEESNALVRAFTEIADALPAIDGYRVDAALMSLGGISAARFEYMDLGELGDLGGRLAFEQSIDEPGQQISAYQYRLDRTRRTLVRDPTMRIVERVDGVLRDVDASDGLGGWRGADRWGELSDLVSQLDRLVGSMVPGRARWTDLHRHLRFAMSNDLSDIVGIDWPSVRAEVEACMYTDREPLPVRADDLGALVRSRPTGPVSTKLRWDALSDEGFERLVFELINNTPGYENANWLMKTHAPDRGRDLEVWRVVADPLTGTRRYRVIVQCKHWLNRSIGSADMIQCIELIKLWEPPVVNELIIATTGRFSADAVALAENRNNDRRPLSVALWPESHLEMLLARRPSLAPMFGLR